MTTEERLDRLCELVQELAIQTEDFAAEVKRELPSAAITGNIEDLQRIRREIAELRSDV